jgi:hypothetical protein
VRHSRQATCDARPVEQEGVTNYWKLESARMTRLRNAKLEDGLSVDHEIHGSKR